VFRFNVQKETILEGIYNIMLFIGTEKETLYFGTRNSIHLNEKYLVYTTRERSVI